MPAIDSDDALWSSYHHNLPRHLLAISRELQARIMHRLQEKRRHDALRLSFEPYITLLAEGDCRLTDLADRLSVSKQSCNQTVNQLEAAGYVVRKAERQDGRVKRLQLTRRGRQLVADGARVTADVEDEFAQLLGASDYRQFAQLTATLVHRLALLDDHSLKVNRSASPLLAGHLPRLAEHINLRLMAMVGARGHKGLKLSHGQVLTLIGPAGGRVAQMARVQEISKQAISAIVLDLEQLGYVQRCADPAASHQVIVHLTTQGLRLLEDSVSAVAELDAHFNKLIGAADFEAFRRHAAALYMALHTEDDVFTTPAHAAVNVHLLARQLFAQLGAQQSRLLASALGALGNEA